MKKGRILSGMRPTGHLHLGNLIGALENWVRLQQDYECFYFVADWHALTTGYRETAAIDSYTREMVLDWLAAGIDPARSVIFVQSTIKQHAELHLLFSMITPLGWLERCPTYKEQLQQLAEREITTYGFLGYPVLQAADILIYRADAVPVGEDQLPHLELTREIARRFNYLYGEFFPEPQALLNRVTILPGLDGRKMSKSYDNCLYLSAAPDEIRQAVRGMITDPGRARRHDPGNPEVCTAFTYHRAFNPARIEEIDPSCREAKIGCVDCKKELAEAIVGYLAPFQARRRELLADPGYVDRVLAEGGERARAVAEETMKSVRRLVGLP
ncbi:MAG: tryptophan--tRNA ligase [Firmicutes bacterium]|nr:tryptophan--tRNA ligase [Bacillota bacterium]